MMNDTTKEYNGKNTYTNNVVCNTLRLGGIWDLVTLNSREEEGGGHKREETKKYFMGSCPIREVFHREKLTHWSFTQI